MGGIAPAADAHEEDLSCRLDKPTRREFLLTTSTAALGAAVPLGKLPAEAIVANARVAEGAPFSAEELFKLGPQRNFTGERATQIAMPIGGIGAGCICLNGNGGLQDFSICERPATTALPSKWSSNSPEAAFAVLHIKGSSGVTKLVEGPFPAFKIFDQGLQGQGLRRGGLEGFPRFAKCVFKGEYPFGEAGLSNPSSPRNNLRGWNPFIPLDDKNSGIPCVILEYELRNTSGRPVEYQFSYHLSHLAPGCKDEQSGSANTIIPGKGVFSHNDEGQMRKHSAAPASR